MYYEIKKVIKLEENNAIRYILDNVCNQIYGQHPEDLTETLYAGGFFDDYVGELSDEEMEDFLASDEYRTFIKEVKDELVKGLEKLIDKYPPIK